MEKRVRLAELSDIDRVLELGYRFLEEGPYKDQLGKNEDVSRRLTHVLINNPNSRVIVAEVDDRVVGTFAFIFYEHYFSGERTAGEIIWYVEPEYRSQGLALEMLWFAEDLAFKMGALRFQLTAPTKAVEEIYKKLHYLPIEVSYQAVLGCRVKH